ncbi:hypothetical protein [Actinoplanes sp. NPDC051411]|uniref:hypothetical protein n=1 Tax=Actinoplanes sp. NPDC051411 TaxID=3155522 RepID=UPI00343CF68D
MAAPWIALGFSIFMTVAGTALATNYRELAAKHVRAAQRWSPRFRRGPADQTPLVILDRIIGGIFAVVGGVMSCLVLLDLIVGPGRLIYYGR